MATGLKGVKSFCTFELVSLFFAKGIASDEGAG